MSRNTLWVDFTPRHLTVNAVTAKILIILRVHQPRSNTGRLTTDQDKIVLKALNTKNDTFIYLFISSFKIQQSNIYIYF